MASSRASTSAGRRRTQAKSAHRKRAADPHKAQHKRKAAATKPKTTTKPKSATKAKPKTPPRRPKPRSKVARPRPGGPGSQSALTRSLTIALVVGTITIGLAAAYLFWFRDSSFVAVEKVSVEGIEGPEAEEVTEALTRAAQKMTTLNVDESELATSVSRFPTAIAIDAEPDFPHALTIEVTARPPVVQASDGGPPVAVAADGTLLHGVQVPEGTLPALDVDSLPVKGKLSGEPLALTEVAGAAPDPLLPLIEDMSFTEDGIEVVLEGSIPVIFGDSNGAGEKWAAVTAVLANPQVKTLTDLDVRVPERPSIGGAAPAPKEG